MFDIGFWELLIIGVVGLLVIGPERLPGVARTIGLYVGKMQRFVQGVKSDIRQEMETGELRELLSAQDKQLKELQNLVQDTRNDVQQGVQQAADELDESSNKYAGIGTALDGKPAPAEPVTPAAAAGDDNTTPPSTEQADKSRDDSGISKSA